MKMNPDGAARGNPGIAGWRVVFRDHEDTDSVAAAKAFQADKVLWKLRAQWDKIKHSGIWLHFTSSWREVNFAVDTSANKGVQLNKGSPKKDRKSKLNLQ
ncbi:hypothetical protein IFM89_000356 [Coptis chinensis]|uniref:RNase H type-1 domain-containing protein n=1 Tax=Coptis chinensis TaxID=261450 RepID=A0A835HEK8_9MAGN|nr:hypothetical protein IFM89_000356 [Coptis chinensis]